MIAVLKQWEFNIYTTLPLILTMLLYLFGVYRLHKRGDKWKTSYIVYFFISLLSLSIALNSFIAVYDDTYLYIHMIQHMLLNMIAPMFFVLSAPMILLLRTLPIKGRKFIVKILHLKIIQILLHPFVASIFLVATTFALYYSSWYEATLNSSFLHNMTHFHMLLIGILWYYPLIGRDPVPFRVKYIFRIIIILITLPFHTILGTSMMSRDRIIAYKYYIEHINERITDTPLYLSLKDDQYMSGALLWISGEFIGILILGFLFRQWIAKERKER